MHPRVTPIPITSPLFGVYCATQLWARAQSLGMYVTPALPLADQPALTAGLDDLAEISCWSTVLLIDPERCHSDSVVAGQGETPAAACLAARRSACSWLQISVRDPVIREWAEDCQAVTLTLSGPVEAVALARRALGIGERDCPECDEREGEESRTEEPFRLGDDLERGDPPDLYERIAQIIGADPDDSEAALCAEVEARMVELRQLRTLGQQRAAEEGAALDLDDEITELSPAGLERAEAWMAGDPDLRSEFRDNNNDDPDAGFDDDPDDAANACSCIGCRGDLAGLVDAVCGPCLNDLIETFGPMAKSPLEEPRPLSDHYMTIELGELSDDELAELGAGGCDVQMDSDRLGEWAPTIAQIEAGDLSEVEGWIGDADPDDTVEVPAAVLQALLRQIRPVEPQGTTK